MLIERQIGIAFVAIGAALVFPGVQQVMQEKNFEVSLGLFITANLLVGAGLGLSMLVAQDDPKAEFVFKVLLIGLIAAAFSSATAYIAFSNSGWRAFWLGIAAVVPITVFVLGFKFRD
jgi:hypothetical protein